MAAGVLFPRGDILVSSRVNWHKGQQLSRGDGLTMVNLQGDCTLGQDSVKNQRSFLYHWYSNDVAILLHLESN